MTLILNLATCNSLKMRIKMAMRKQMLTFMFIVENSNCSIKFHAPKSWMTIIIVLKMLNEGVGVLFA